MELGGGLAAAVAAVCVLQLLLLCYLGVCGVCVSLSVAGAVCVCEFVCGRCSVCVRVRVVNFFSLFLVLFEFCKKIFVSIFFGFV